MFRSPSPGFRVSLGCGVMKLRLRIIVASIFVVWTVSGSDAAFARDCRIDLIPNGRVNSCSNCHISRLGGGARTPFGEAVRSRVIPGSCSSFWGPELAAIDSDFDGRTNGTELGDPLGAWRGGDPEPGDPRSVTNPGVRDNFSSGEIDVTPLALEFGDICTGATFSRVVEVRNLGSGALEVRDATFAVGSSPAFAIANPFDPVNLAPSAMVLISVDFEPTADGPHSGTLVVTSDDADESSVLVALSGTAVPQPAPRIGVTPAELHFGTAIVGETSSSIVEVRNHGTASLHVSAVSFNPSSNPGFSLREEFTPLELTANETHSLAIDFAPVEVGQATGTLTFESDDPHAPSTEIALFAAGIVLWDVPFARGDSNGDGELDISDAVYVLRFLFSGGIAPSCEKTADSNDSGEADVSDVVYYLANRFQGGPPPPDPFRECGLDPTPDELDCEAYAPCE